MKGQFSRFSFRPEARYSGVYHAQGAMITDADLDERSEIVKARTDALGADTVRDGCPATGGAVDLSGAAPALREGTIYADGVRGLLRFEGGVPADLAEAVKLQADFPEGPALPAGARIVYADIWERAVFPLEDPYLADPGLHGAETALRSRTMCQIKTAPLADAADVAAGTGAYPLVGTATLAVAERTPESVVDACDPCAEVISPEAVVANTLWRLEVVRVRGRPDAPTSVDIAWSAENGAAIAPGDISSELFERAGAVYERFSAVTEQHMGAAADLTDLKDAVFVTDLDTGGDAGMPFVRRWDGWARVNMAAGTIQTRGAGFTVSMAGGAVTLVLDSFEATLTLAGASVLKGDFWLVETRTFADEGARIRLADPLPVGIRHHHCVLFRATDGLAEAPGDAARRRLSFPPLTDLPASHVSIDNTCPKLYGTAETVQQALDSLCGIDAADIPFDNNCPRLYDGATTVQQALDSLCRVDFGIETVLRLLMDWGVVCGLTVAGPSRPSPRIRVAGGWALDRGGRLFGVEAAEIDIDKLVERLDGRDREAFPVLFRQGAICLTVALDGERRPGFHLVPKDRAFGPDDPGLEEVVRRCLEQGKAISVNDRLVALAEADRAPVQKAVLVAANPATLGRSQRMVEAEATRARGFMDTLQREFDGIAAPEEREALAQRLKTLDEDFAADRSVGVQKEVRRMQYVAGRFSAVLDADQDRRRRCLCAGLFPTCPPEPGPQPWHVPLACLTGLPGQQGFEVTKVCMFDCRKQAMTWRSAGYVLKDWRERLATQLGALCCAPQQDPGKDGPIWDPKLAEGALLHLAQTRKVFDGVIGPDVLISDRFTRRVDIDDLGREAARDVLTGQGGEIVTEIDIADAGAVARIAQATGGDVARFLSDPGDIAPGDRLAMLVEDGKARGYVVVERGGGRFFFPPESERKVKGPTDLSAVETGIADLAGRRDGLAADIERLKAETEALRTARDEARRGIEAAGADLARLAEAQRAASDEIAGLAARRDEIVRDLREAQPVAALEVPEAVRDKLARGGIFSVADARRGAERLDLSRTERTALMQALDRFGGGR